MIINKGNFFILIVKKLLTLNKMLNSKQSKKKLDSNLFKRFSFLIVQTKFRKFKIRDEYVSYFTKLTIRKHVFY